MYISCIRHVVLIPISHKLSFRVVKMFVIPKILGICVCSAEARYGSREHNDIHWGVYRPTQHVCPDDILLQGDIAGWSGVNCKKNCIVIKCQQKYPWRIQWLSKLTMILCIANVSTIVQDHFIKSYKGEPAVLKGGKVVFARVMIFAEGLSGAVASGLGKVRYLN